MSENDTTGQFKTVEILIPADAGGERLDKYIGRLDKVNLTRSRIQKLIKDNLVIVNGRPAGHNHVLQGGETVQIKIPPPPESDIKPEDIPLDIVFEDDFLLVVNKPAGMVTHPAAGNYAGTLVNAVMHHCRKLSQRQGSDRPGIVHRLDKNTSGLIILAKNDDIHLSLQEKIQRREIKRTYKALICGHMKEDEGEINLPVGRSIKDRKKMTVTRLKSREALTYYRVIDRFRLYDLLEVNLQTGRTHQIRVHFSHLGHPVFGDPDYGGRLKWHRGVFSIDKQLAKTALEIMPRQALHAWQLEFIHPITQKPILLQTELPDDFGGLLDFLVKEGR